MNTAESISRSDILRVGTRGSALALAQTRMVIAKLTAMHSGLSFVEKIVSTEGDRDKTSPLTLIGGRGVFTSALQQGLLDGEIELAVHSAKDVPSISPPGLVIAAFPDREDPRDALISRHGVSLAELPRNPIIGTSSRRRAVQILALRPDAQIRELRGNIDTRLRKSLTDEFDAIVLAVAGVTRMGWADRITQCLEIDVFTPAPAQGAIAVESRIGETSELAAAIDDIAVSGAVRIERLFLRGVGGGCTTPIGAYAEVAGTDFVLQAMLSDDSGERLVRERVVLSRDDEDGVADLAARMLRETRPSWTPGSAAETPASSSVLVTGTVGQTGSLSERLSELGFETLVMETVRIERPASQLELKAGARFDWLVVTSPNAFPQVSGVLTRLMESGAKLAVVGRRTADAALSFGFAPDIVGEKDAESLANRLIEHAVSGSRVLCLTSDLARPTLPESLQAAGAEVLVVGVYRTLPVQAVDPEIATRIASGAISAVTFASPSSVKQFLVLLGSAVTSLSGASFVAIGETTAEAMRMHGLPVHGVAGDPTADGFAQAVLAAVGATTGGLR